MNFTRERAAEGGGKKERKRGLKTWQASVMFNINRWWVFSFLLFSNLIKHQLLQCKEQKTIFCLNELLTTKKLFSNMTTNISICETRTSWRKMCALNWYSEIVFLFLKNEKVHVARKIQICIATFYIFVIINICFGILK